MNDVERSRVRNGEILILGDIVQLADSLWLVVGDLPADIPNSIVYHQGGRLYLIDTGAGPTVRASIMRVLQKVGPVQSFTLLNSHGHADHTGNNDLVHMVRAKETHHYLSKAGARHASSRPILLTSFISSAIFKTL